MKTIMKPIKRFMTMLPLMLLTLVTLATAVVAKGPKLSDLTNNQWLKLIANTLLIAGALFLIYIYAVPSDKADQRRQWIIAIAILGLCAMLAYQFMTDIWFWQTKILGNILHQKVLINIGVTAAALFSIFVIAQAMSSKLGEKMSKTSIKYLAITVIVLLSFNIALKPFFENGKEKSWDDVKDSYQYIWQRPDIAKGKLYLFGDSTCTDKSGRRYCYYDTEKTKTASKEIKGYGILRPPYILIFGLSILLAIWVLRTFKFLTDIDWLQWIIAILLSAAIAHKGMTINTFSSIAQIVSIIVIQKAMRTADSNMKPWLAWGSAFAIVGAVTYYAFPDYSFAFFKMIYGLGFWWGVGIMVVLGVIVSMIAKGFGNKDKSELKKRWRHDLETTIGNKVKEGLLGTKKLKGVAKIVDIAYPLKLVTAEGEVNQIFKEMNVEFHALMNYMLRLEVFFGKLSTIKSSEKEANEAQAYTISGNQSQDTIQEEFNRFKHGTGLIAPPKSFVDIAVKNLASRDRFGFRKLSKNQKHAGGMSAHYIAYQYFAGLVNENGVLSHRWNETWTDAQKDLTALLNDSWTTPVGETFTGNFNKLMKDNFEDRSAPKYSRFKRFGAINKMYSLRSMILDQYRMTGEYYHTYLFVHPRAKIEKYIVDLESGKKTKISGGGEIGFINPANDESSISFRSGYEKKIFKSVYPFEMDKDGWIVQDMNIAMERRVLKKQGKNVPRTYIQRKVVPGESLIWGNLTDIMKWQRTEWTAFLDDLRDGRHHPHSRTVLDYIDAHNENNFKYANVKMRNGSPASKNPAFDREALKNPGDNKWWGRKNYWSDLPDINKVGIKQPYPALSTTGLTRYLKETVIRFMEDDKLAEQQLQRFIYDSGAAEGEIFIRNPTEASE